MHPYTTTKHTNCLSLVWLICDFHIREIFSHFLQLSWGEADTLDVVRPTRYKGIYHLIENQEQNSKLIAASN